MRANAENALHQLRALRPHQTAYPKDFSPVQLEGRAAEAARVDGRKILQFKDHLVGDVAFSGRIQIVQLPAYHLGDDRVGSQVFGLPRADVFAVAHDGDLVGDAQDFFHLVTDVNDAYAVGLQVGDDAKQRLHFMFCQGRGRLVQNQHVAVIGYRLGDFY